MADAPILNDAAQALAKEHDLDVAALVEAGEITATGSTGDVLKGDVQKYLDGVEEARAAEADRNENGVPDGAEPDFEGEGLGYFKVAGAAPISAVVADANRVLHPDVRYRLPNADPGVRALLKKGDLSAA